MHSNHALAPIPDAPDSAAPLHIAHVNLAKGFRGGERQTELLIRHLAPQASLSQTLVCRADSPLRERLRDVPVRFVTAAQAWQGHGGITGADVVHAHEARAVHWAWLHRALKGVPYLLTRRVTTPVRDNAFNRLIYRRAAVVVALSAAIADTVRPLASGSVARIPSAMAHLPHDDGNVAQLRAELGDGFFVGHVGALVDRHKGQRVLLQAVRLVAEQAPDMRFLFLGDGADADVLAAESADLPQVRWLGFHANVGDYLALLDVFAFPSREEGLGSTLLDVMDYGVPIVASDVGGIPDIVRDGVTGLLVPNGDAQALAQALLLLYREPAMRRNLADGARQSLQDYTPQRMAQRYLALYRTIVG